MVPTMTPRWPAKLLALGFLAWCALAACEPVPTTSISPTGCPTTLPGLPTPIVNAQYPCVDGVVAIQTTTVINQPVPNDCDLIVGCTDGSYYRFGTAITSGGYSYFVRVVKGPDCSWETIPTDQATYDYWNQYEPIFDPYGSPVCDWPR